MDAASEAAPALVYQNSDQLISRARLPLSAFAAPRPLPTRNSRQASKLESACHGMPAIALFLVYMQGTLLNQSCISTRDLALQKQDAPSALIRCERSLIYQASTVEIQL